MKVIGVIGLPGSGKSTMMKQFMSTRHWVMERPVDLLDSHFSGGIRILGKYEEGEVYSGTDRLSMAVQPKAIEYLNDNSDDVMIFEGDRLTSVNFFQAAVDAGHDVYIIELTVSREERERRYELRGSNQSDTFINGRATKINKINEQFGEKILVGEPGIVTQMKHTNEEDTNKIVSHIESIINH